MPTVPKNRFGFNQDWWKWLVFQIFFGKARSKSTFVTLPIFANYVCCGNAGVFIACSVSFGRAISNSWKSAVLDRFVNYLNHLASDRLNHFMFAYPLWTLKTMHAVIATVVPTEISTSVCAFWAVTKIWTSVCKVWELNERKAFVNYKLKTTPGAVLDVFETVSETISPPDC
jgi:hypothetical protein